jgi:hypothetical protein
MDESLDPRSLRLSRDPSGSLDVDRVKRLSSVLGVKADCVHCAVSIGKRIGD